MIQWAGQFFMQAKFREGYQKANRVSRGHLKKRPFLVPVLGILIGFIVVGIMVLTHGGRNLRPSSAHVVYVFDQGHRQTISTKAATVGELVNKLPLKLINEDVIEPSLNTEIVEDNFRVNVYRARPVTILDNGRRSVAVTAQKSPRIVAEAAGLSLFAEDKAAFEPGSVREGIIGEKVVVQRATPVTLNLYGNLNTIRTHTKTVGEMLREKGVRTDTDDTFTPGVETPIAAGMIVSVVKNGIQVATVTEEIAPPIQTIQDDSLSFGATVVRQPGVAGKKIVTYQILVENGAEVSRSVLQSLVVEEPVPQIVARGKAIDINADKTQLMAAAGIAESDFPYVNFIISHESGWCWLKWQGQIGYCPTHYEELHSTSSGFGYGLCQSTPAGKMASAGADYLTNPITQLKWCSGYAGRYGGWSGAYEFWLSHRWW